MSATIECPECRTVVDGADPICRYCGARLPKEPIVLAQRPCPRCRGELGAAVVGDTPVERCGRCGGMWLAREALAALIGNRQAQRKVVAAPEAEVTAPENRPRPALCPSCGGLLDKVAFAPGSTIQIDRCIRHGVWFDRTELHDAAEFVLSGKLEVARLLERAEQELEAAAGHSPAVAPPVEADPDLRPGALFPRGHRFFEALGRLLKDGD